jgi:hypothetical protein
MNEEILNTRGDQAFYMGAENAKIESAEKSAETDGHPKNGCLEDNFKSAMAIAQPMLLKASKENKGAILPTPHALAAAGNRIRSKTRPKHPKSQFFDIDKDNIPTGFFQ